MIINNSRMAIPKIYFIKHRPQKADDLLYNKHLEKYSNIIFNNHLLIHGPSGSGKLTICKILLHKIYGDSIYKMTESSYVIKNKHILKYYHSKHHFEFDVFHYLNKDKYFVSDLIKNLSSSLNVLTQKYKIMVIKNADKLTILSQQMLRRIIEKSKGYFIFITSKLSKIINPIKSRVFLLRVSYPSDKEKTLLLRTIAKKEGFKISKRNLDIIKSKTSNVKELISLLQICYMGGRFKNRDLTYVEDVKNLLKFLPKINVNNYAKFKDMIYDMYVTDTDFLKYIYQVVKEVTKKLNNDNDKFKLIQYAAECDLNIKNSNKPPIPFEKFILQTYDLMLENGLKS